MSITIDPMTRKPDHLIPTRYSLLSRLHNWDDQESWKVFFDTYWRLIYEVAIKSGLTAAEAQDVVQETIISVAKGIHRFERSRELGSFKNWLRTLIRWRIHDQVSRRIPPTTRGSDFFGQAAANLLLNKIPDTAGISLEATWEREWQQNLLDAAIDRVKRRVKEEHYQMFDLYVLKKWPVTKVARTLRVSSGQVYLAKHRVARLIKKEIQILEKKLY